MALNNVLHQDSSEIRIKRWVVRFFRWISGEKKAKVQSKKSSESPKQPKKMCQLRGKQSRLTGAYPDYPLTLGRFGRQ